MPPAISPVTLLAVATLLVCLPGAYAFGAGDIPGFSFYEGKAFRHGDIENVLEELATVAGGMSGGEGILGFAKKIMDAGSGNKFKKDDIKKVYFGNWLRDYSQAMDIAGLSKLSADTLVLIVSVLGFVTFGFATREFEVTADRLGVYLPVEHIDNPKGYAEKEGDARQFHPKLRPPVNPEELEIDERTGMKNYMASDGRGWDTSTAHIRRTLLACIENGRNSRGREGEELYEAYRLLGTGLHTLEDLLAHSNWCELALRKMGHENVFCHVGDEVLINTPNGEAPPLVTGSFGSADFMHSMMGEATDHISQSSVTDLSKKMDEAKNSDSESLVSNLKDLISKFSLGGGDEKMNEAEDMKAQSKAYDFNPDDVAPPEVQQNLINLLRWRDDTMRDIIEKIEMVPGLSDLVENITEALNAYVFSILAPWLAPILSQATDVLAEGSKAVIDTEDQYEVFNNPRASDPSHSLLSKDHFGLILNEPAGLIAKEVVKYSVNNIVQAWKESSEDPERVVDTILEAFHHPYYADGRSRIQSVMFETMDRWLNSLEDRDSVLENLTKESVREGKNKREASEDETAAEPVSSQQYGAGRQSYGQGQQQQSYGQEQSYGRQQQAYGQQDSYGQREESYGQREQSYGQREESYGQREDYSRPSEGYGGQREERSYGQGQSYGQEESRRNAYGNESGYGQEQSYGSSRAESGYQPSYEQPQSEYGRRGEGGYGGEQESTRRESEYGGGGGYGGNEEYGRSEQPHYGGEERSYGGRTGGYGEDSSGYGEERSGRGYGGGYGEAEREERDETFGVERLNVRGEGYGGGEGYSRDESYGGGYNSGY